MLWYRPKGNNNRTRNKKYTPTLWTHRHAYFLDGSINRIHIRGKRFVILLSNMKIGTAYRRARRSLQCCPVTEHWYRIIIFSSFMSLMRGAVLEWLEHLGYGADSRRIA